jgi:hypothetical protein
MKQQTTSALAHSSVQLSTLSEKGQKELDKALLKWFSGHIVKTIKISTLRQIYQAGHYDAFAELLTASTDVVFISVLSKVDKYRPDIQMSSTNKAMSHLRKLASGEIEPAPAPKSRANTRRASKSTSRQKTDKSGILVNSKY